MNKFNWKNRTFIAGLLSLVLVGFGVKHPEVWSGVGAAAACAKVKCDA